MFPADISIYFYLTFSIFVLVGEERLAIDKFFGFRWDNLLVFLF